MNPFSLLKTAGGGKAAGPPGSRCCRLLLGRGRARQLAGGPQLAREGRQSRARARTSPGAAGALFGLLGALWVRRLLGPRVSLLPGRHGVVRGIPQLPLRVRYPPHRADPEPQSGAHQPRGAARHPRLRDRVSGPWAPGCARGKARSPGGAAALREEGWGAGAGSRLPGPPFSVRESGAAGGDRRGAEGRPGLGGGRGRGCQHGEVTSGWWDSLTGVVGLLGGSCRQDRHPPEGDPVPEGDHPAGVCIKVIITPHQTTWGGGESEGRLFVL